MPPRESVACGHVSDMSWTCPGHASAARVGRLRLHHLGEAKVGEAHLWGDMGRYGEIWGDMGRYGEVWGDMGR